MKRAILVVLVAAALIVAYRRFSSAAPVKIYEAFAEEMLHRRYDNAASMSAGLTSADLADLGTQERIGAGPAMFQTLFRSTFTIESQEQASDGTVSVGAFQRVLFTPAGVASAVRPAMYADMRQTVRLKKVDRHWKVASFTNTFEKMDELRHR